MVEKQDRKDIRLVTEGYGIDITFPMEEQSSPFVIVHSPFEDSFDVALLQGGVQATAVENGLALKWSAPYGYWRADRNGKGEAKQTQNRAWERDAFQMAWNVYDTVLEILKTAKTVKTAPKEVDGQHFLHIQLTEMQSLIEQINLKLVTEYSKTFRLRDEAGYYRWIGLTSGSKSLSTIMKIPRAIEGSKDIFLRASSVPYSNETSTALTPFNDTFQEAVICGLCHGFENRTVWDPRTAIRSALIHYVFKGNLDTNRLLAAASRVGMYPRLGSRTSVGLDDGSWMWVRLAALGIAWEFFKRNYIPTWNANQGEVRYIFSGVGLTKILEDMILQYLSSSMVSVGYNAANKPGGLFFLPASNESESTYKLDFVHLAENEDTDAMSIAAIDLRAKVYVQYAEDILRVTKDGLLSITEEQQKQYAYHPVTVEPIHSVRQELRLLGAGFEERTMVIRDRLNDAEVWQPSQMLYTLAIGWQPAYSPNSVIFKGRQSPSRLDQYRYFEVLTSSLVPTIKRKPDETVNTGQSALG